MRCGKLSDCICSQPHPGVATRVLNPACPIHGDLYLEPCESALRQGMSMKEKISGVIEAGFDAGVGFDAVADRILELFGKDAVVSIKDCSLSDKCEEVNRLITGWNKSQQANAELGILQIELIGQVHDLSECIKTFHSLCVSCKTENDRVTNQWSVSGATKKIREREERECNAPFTCEGCPAWYKKSSKCERSA